MKSWLQRISRYILRRFRELTQNPEERRMPELTESQQTQPRSKRTSRTTPAQTAPANTEEAAGIEPKDQIAAPAPPVAVESNLRRTAAALHEAGEKYMVQSGQVFLRKSIPTTPDKENA